MPSRGLHSNSRSEVRLMGRAPLPRAQPSGRASRALSPRGFNLGRGGRGGGGSSCGNDPLRAGSPLSETPSWAPHPHRHHPECLGLALPPAEPAPPAPRAHPRAPSLQELPLPFCPPAPPTPRPWGQLPPAPPRPLSCFSARRGPHPTPTPRALGPPLPRQEPVS